MIPFVFNENYNLTDSNGLILMDKPIFSCLMHPVKLDATVGVVCLNGTMEGTSNMRYFEAHSNNLLILIEGNTVTINDVSDNFTGLFIIMSSNFSERLNIEDQLPVFLSLHQNPCILLNHDDLVSMKSYFKVVQKLLHKSNNPYVQKIVQHLTTALFYALSYNVHKLRHFKSETKSTRQEVMVENFLNEVLDNFKTERGIKFYSDKLFVTPKYLSKVVKEHNGLSAKKWIENYVVWEAKALLKSTNMTIQQISDELNFPSQSFFGKYFKRSVGLSPFEYRK